MLIYIVVINYSINQDYGPHVFDSVHTNKESADKRCSDIINGIDLTSDVLSVFHEYEYNKSTKRLWEYFKAEVIPVQIEPNQPISFLLTDTYVSDNL